MEGRLTSVEANFRKKCHKKDNDGSSGEWSGEGDMVVGCRGGKGGWGCNKCRQELTRLLIVFL